MRSWSPHLYTSEGRDRSVPEPVLRNATLAYQKVAAVSADLTPVLTLRHLSHMTGTSYYFLRAAVSRTIDPYYYFKIKKRGKGRGQRQIAVPDARLRAVQTWINEHILSVIKPAPESFAYHPKSSIIACASRHVRARWLIKLDIKDFFPSIREFHVYRVFRSLGYEALISFEMTRLCTMAPKAGQFRGDAVPGFGDSARGREPRPYTIWSYGPRAAGYLPMGAPTSPMISNLYMRDFDSKTSLSCMREGVIYSRYADDLIMSTDRKDFTRSDAARLARACRDAIVEYGLWPNAEKVTIVPPGARHVVLGLTTNDDIPRIGKRFKSRLRQHYYYIEKFGLELHAKERHFSIPQLQRHLEGLLTYASYVDANAAEPFWEEHRAIGWPNIP